MQFMRTKETAEKFVRYRNDFASVSVRNIG